MVFKIVFPRHETRHTRRSSLLLLLLLLPLPLFSFRNEPVVQSLQIVKGVEDVTVVGIELW